MPLVARSAADWPPSDTVLSLPAGGASLLREHARVPPGARAHEVKGQRLVVSGGRRALPECACCRRVLCSVHEERVCVCAWLHAWTFVLCFDTVCVGRPMVAPVRWQCQEPAAVSGVEIQREEGSRPGRPL